WQCLPPANKAKEAATEVVTNVETTPQGISPQQSPSLAEQASLQDKSNKLAGRGNELPIVRRLPLPLWLKWMIIGTLPMVVALAFIVLSDLFMTHLPFLTPIYHSIGMYRSQGIILKDVAIKREKLANNEQLLITGKIINFHTEPRVLPRLRIALLDSNKKQIASHTLNSSGKELQPQEEYHLNNKITRLPSSAKYLTLDIGGKMELILR
ncbi:MAG: hypothetical protein ACK4M7_06005, partial [Burkholderiales bacterium]